MIDLPGGADPAVWSTVHDAHARNVPVVVLTGHQTVEEGNVTMISNDGFRVGSLGHWVRWSDVIRAGERKR